MWWLIEHLAYHLVCAHFGHRPGPWSEVNGPVGTVACHCRRCHLAQFRIHGVFEEWKPC
jgi:hypothetical protein